MNAYLTIMVTVLVATQVIRIIQNTIQLWRQNKVIMKQLDSIDDISNDDIQTMIKANSLIVEYLEEKLNK